MNDYPAEMKYVMRVHGIVDRYCDVAERHLDRRTPAGLRMVASARPSDIPCVDADFAAFDRALGREA